MSTRNGLKLVTAGALAIASISFPTFASAARDRSAATTELSAQSTQNQKNKTTTKTVAPRPAPVRVAPRQVRPRVITRQAPVRVVPRQTTPRVIQRQVVPQGGLKTVGPRGVKPVTVTPRVISPRTGQLNTTRRAFTPRGNNARVVTAARIRSAPARGAFRTTIRGHNYSVWRSGYRVRHGNRWRTFVALGALGVLAIGAYEYYPYAYIDAPVDYCEGLTEDGCQLVYDEVQTVEGDVVGQCVAYCPWQ